MQQLTSDGYIPKGQADVQRLADQAITDANVAIMEIQRFDADIDALRNVIDGAKAAQDLIEARALLTIGSDAKNAELRMARTALVLQEDADYVEREEFLADQQLSLGAAKRMSAAAERRYRLAIERLRYYTARLSSFSAG